MIETRDILKLKGPVKSLSETAYFIENGEYQKDEYHNFFIEFNPNGFVKTLINIDHDITYKYKSNSSILGLKKFAPGNDLLRQIMLDGETNEFQSESTHYFNNNGNIIHSVYTDSNGDISMYIRYIYDDFYRLIKVAKYRAGYFSLDDQLSELETFEYNLDDEIIKSRIEYPLSDTNKIKTNYYELNNNGDLISEKIKDEYDCLISSIKYSYIYDEFGNWTNKNAYINGKKYMIIKRNLNYI